MAFGNLVRLVVVKHKVEAIRSLAASQKLLDHMKQFGTVTSFKFMRDPVTNERTGLAFVSYLQYSDAEEAIRTRLQTVSGLPEPHNTIDVTPKK
ncbi:hypothetical protein LPJ78_002686 [Coemansia sp. RSA 989]|nr:hypothetical protein LPJ68_001189 [Coemansia sp. RSA 1086]KAJ1750942.1 hypothetical protein LPJ79_002527 [Coemansia sp. RSA 1821]KAJ1865512.1 hypothetical protein LPJ78_002686 [Coemansia sp. RSA 989]KAJ1872843.1 hypothetical protein LPJ55_002738 [Coemansia sp. RSA 990]KAJ2633434.1 hypothetical protein H4R22_000432 [Coemansia sp. RSA 1290]KAJ2646788.1 hypothetical protein IWW40_005148 [Coemansia sp. RSA 1250]KAJ2676574.1 hypothetical protein IWW42_000449 [Coemansia sp. RSA 1085]